MRTLAPDRLAIATHPDLLAIVRDGRSAVPVDQFRSPNPRAGVEPFVATLAGWFGVSSYTADAVPSVWKLERPGGTTVLAVFNWTGGRLQRSLTFDALGLRSVAYQARDVWIGATGAVSDRIDFDQPARSVTLLELTPR